MSELTAAATRVLETGTGLDEAGVHAVLAAPDLAAGENLHDLPAVTGVPLLGALPEQAGGLRADAFACVARHGLGPALRGRWQTPGP